MFEQLESTLSQYDQQKGIWRTFANQSDINKLRAFYLRIKPKTPGERRELSQEEKLELWLLLVSRRTKAQRLSDRLLEQLLIKVNDEILNRNFAFFRPSAKNAADLSMILRSLQGSYILASSAHAKSAIQVISRYKNHLSELNGFIEALKQTSAFKTKNKQLMIWKTIEHYSSEHGVISNLAVFTYRVKALSKTNFFDRLDERSFKMLMFDKQQFLDQAIEAIEVIHQCNLSKSTIGKIEKLLYSCEHFNKICTAKVLLQAMGQAKILNNSNALGIVRYLTSTKRQVQLINLPRDARLLTEALTAISPLFNWWYLERTLEQLGKMVNNNNQGMMLVLKAIENLPELKTLDILTRLNNNKSNFNRKLAAVIEVLKYTVLMEKSNSKKTFMFLQANIDRVEDLAEILYHQMNNKEIKSVEELSDFLLPFSNNNFKELQASAKKCNIPVRNLVGAVNMKYMSAQVNVIHLFEGYICLIAYPRNIDIFSRLMAYAHFLDKVDSYQYNRLSSRNKIAFLHKAFDECESAKEDDIERVSESLSRQLSSMLLSQNKAKDEARKKRKEESKEQKPKASSHERVVYSSDKPSKAECKRFGIDVEILDSDDLVRLNDAVQKVKKIFIKDSRQLHPDMIVASKLREMVYDSKNTEAHIAEVKAQLMKEVTPAFQSFKNTHEKIMAYLNERIEKMRPEPHSSTVFATAGNCSGCEGDYDAAH